jgi:hypothetical protein
MVAVVASILSLSIQSPPIKSSEKKRWEAALLHGPSQFTREAYNAFSSLLLAKQLATCKKEEEGGNSLIE